MPIEHVPLLQIARDLHDIPRGVDRFEAYLDAMLNDDRDDVRYAPLMSMNPMGREHINARLDKLLALDADGVAARAVAEVVATLGDTSTQALQHGLSMMDDVQGGWTNRTSSEAAVWAGYDLPLKRPWLTTAWWASDVPSVEGIRRAVMRTLRRHYFIAAEGRATSLQDILRQEGTASAFAGFQPVYDADELAYTRQVIDPLRGSTDYAVHVAALLGDAAARELGYAPLGLSDRAGLDLALVLALEDAG
jgi:hypothetical protein